MPKFEFFSKLMVAGNCKNCKARIENRLKTEPGVYAVAWEIETKMLTVHYEYEIIVLDQIKAIILSLGHDVEGHRASDSDFVMLPHSCRYRIIEDGKALVLCPRNSYE